ncbi:MAG TPA: DUF3574 domain-containing protein [Polyangiaceae bacterium]|nr:DUF3574 domain-containing protein [Polyangiaceae bacterium]
MNRHSFLGILLLTATSALGCAEEDTAPIEPEPSGLDAEANLSICPGGGSAFARTELFFGLSRSAGPDITEGEFAGFVDAKVTPRFPDGLTLIDGDGQFRGADGEIIREGSKLLILLHGGSNAESKKIEAIRTDYKTQFQQESVLRTDIVNCVSF